MLYVLILGEEFQLPQTLRSLVGLLYAPGLVEAPNHDAGARNIQRRSL
jgi:hypothetical protein